MQTKVLIILSIFFLQTLQACTRPKSNNDKETTEILSMDTVDVVVEQGEVAPTSLPKIPDTIDAAPIELVPVKIAEKKNTPEKLTKKESPEVAIESKAIDPPVSEASESILPPAQEVEDVKEETMAPKALSHEIWNQLLQKYVSASGKVSYKGLKAEKNRLEEYLSLLSENTPTEAWGRNERLAYWINVYNAFTVKLILDNYPLNSITDLGKPWDKAFIKLGSETYTLNQVENEIIRPNFKEARIHFAVNCAAKSCPPLLNEAFTAEKLNSQLNKQTRAFINGPANEITRGKVQLSKIFDWYGEDFGNLIAFLNKYSTTKIDTDAKIGYKEYDWALNE